MRSNAVGGTCVVLALAALGVQPSPGEAAETVSCRWFVQSVPYTISAPGHYCFRRDLSTSLSAGAAITIDASFVWLDLNNFKLEGSGSGSMEGIVAGAGHRNITVRQGVVRGFFNGIRLGVGSSGANHTVERIWADQNKANGIAVRATGGGHEIRDNVVTNTGGTDPGDNGVPVSVFGAASISRNRVFHAFGDGSLPGGGDGIAFDLQSGPHTVVDNRAAEAGIGFSCDGSGQYLRDNISVDTPLAYSPGCVQLGATNFP